MAQLLLGMTASRPVGPVVPVVPLSPQRWHHSSPARLPVDHARIQRDGGDTSDGKVERHMSPQG